MAIARRFILTNALRAKNYYQKLMSFGFMLRPGSDQFLVTFDPESYISIFEFFCPKSMAMHIVCGHLGSIICLV